MKKILFVIDTIDIGGATKLTFDLINEIDKTKYEVKIIYLNEAKFKGPNLLDYYNFKDISEYVWFKKYRSLKRIKYFYKIFRKYDLVHSCMEQSNFYTSLIKNIPFSNFKLIITYHGLDSVYTKDASIIKLKQKSSYVFVMKYLQNVLFKKTDKYISVCRDLKKYLINERGINEEKIKIIYQGLNFNYIIRIDDDKNVRPDSQYFTIGYLGRLGYSKGLEGFIETAENLKRKIPNLRIAIKGDGELKSYLEKFIKEMNMGEYIFIESFDKNVFNFYRKLNLFVLPSFYETTNLTVLESMYAGTVVLASDIGGIPEIIEDKKNGFLFECGNFKDLENKVLDIYKLNYSDLNDIRSNAFNTVSGKFNFNKNIRNIENQFDELLNIK